MRGVNLFSTALLNKSLVDYASSTTIDPGRIGEISNDRSAIVGRDGWCFIYEGSNNYRAAYLDQRLAPLAEEWARLIAQRQSYCDSLGIHFIQIIVPNKATLMPERFPERIGSGMTTILQKLLDASPAANLICPVEEMRQSSVREAIFRRNDSHLTLAGNTFITELIFNASGVDIGYVPRIEVCKVNHVGDLGSKFNTPIVESFYAPRFDIGLLNQEKIEKTYEVVIEGFNGTKQSFHNPGAPIKKTVLVFGNSFFERNPSWGISPLFIALFENFHFIWAPRFIVEEVRSLNPDLVLSQTCERFLTKVQS